MKITYFLPALLLVGCATHDHPLAEVDPGPLPQDSSEVDSSSVRTPEELKAYPVGRYEDPNDPEIMHEGHTIYRAETSPAWNTAPNAPTYVPLGPTFAVANPSQQHVALSADLEQKLKEEDQLLQTTYEQNARLSQEIKNLENANSPREPAAPSPVAAPQPATPTPPPPPAPSVTPPSRTWTEWFHSLGARTTPPSKPKGN